MASQKSNSFFCLFHKCPFRYAAADDLLLAVSELVDQQLRLFVYIECDSITPFEPWKHFDHMFSDFETTRTRVSQRRFICWLLYARRLTEHDRQREIHPAPAGPARPPPAIHPDPVCLGRAPVGSSTGARPVRGALAFLPALCPASGRPLEASSLLLRPS